MGDVYSAYDPELDRKIALKLLPGDRSAGGGRDEAEARLLREAQAMAKLSHPNVIAVHDAGTFEGHVFIAMEFIEGTTLKGWLEAGPRSWTEILAVMLPAARGLAAAHQAGIIHRDFKPANVMIRDDGAIRVLDFGLARRLEAPTEPSVDAEEQRDVLSRSHDSLDGNLTRTGMVTGTPAYMAPEQFSGADQDERTDQFGFCVALYEALYGERPFPGKELETISKAVRSGQFRTVPSGARVPVRVRRCLLRGLAADPSARYPSMAALIADLDRAARPRWRRLAPWAAGTFAASALGLAVVMPAASADSPCRGAQGQMGGVWDDARRAEVAAAFEGVGLAYASRANEAVQARLDAYRDGWVEQSTEACEATRVRHEQSEDLLDRRMACLDQRRTELSALTSLLATADAQMVEKSIDATGKLPSLRGCEAANVLRDRVAPPDAAIAAEVAELRAELARIKVLVNARKVGDALEPSEHALERARALGYAPLLGQALLSHGSLIMAAGKAAESRTWLDEALLVAEATGDDELELRTRVTLTSLVGAVLAEGEEGAVQGRLARAVSQRIPPDGDLAGVVDLVQGLVAYRVGEYPQARDYLEAAVAARLEEFGEDSEAVAMVLTNLGAVLVATGDNEEALATFERALKIHRAVYGQQHPIVATTLNNLSLAKFRLGRLEEARADAEQTVDIWSRSLPPGHPDLAKGLHNLGAILAKLGRDEEALVSYERALQIKVAVLGDDDPSVALSRSNVADSLNHLGRFEEALPHVEKAAKTLRAKLGDEHPELGGFYGTYAESLLGVGRRDEALAMLERALKILDANPGLVEDRAINHMVLARALASDPTRRADARHAAERARNAYAELGSGFDEARAQGDAWLVAHPDAG
jgi:tetratricopeptide (TPR) repeat protein/tRNA A-37 threonylcarbamoyl transferase component Bud32